MLNKSTDWSRAISQRRFHILGIVSLVAAGVALLLAVKVAPWLYAMNVHVRLHLQAPAETKINVCWDKARTQCLPLVPYLSTEKRIADPGEVADLWLSELPPRPVYSISLVLESNLAGGVFQDLELDCTNFLFWGWLPGVGFPNTRIGIDKLHARDITLTPRDAVYYVNGDSGGRLIAVREIHSGSAAGSGEQTTILMLWGLLFSVYLFIHFLSFCFHLQYRT